jgi:hypothetical protein
MDNHRPHKVWHLTSDRRVTPRANGHAWRVVAADWSRVDTTVADYLFCGPDFLFPADGVGRALRLEIDPLPRTVPRPRRPVRPQRASCPDTLTE